MNLDKQYGANRQSVLLVDEHFTDNRNNWEVIDEPDEKSVVTGEGLYLENNTKHIWNYYKIPTSLCATDSFLFDVTFQVLKKKKAVDNRFGLLWGFSNEPKILNSFTADPSANRFCVETIIRRKAIYDQIDKGNIQPLSNPDVYRMLILKMDKRHYFFVNNIRGPVCRQHPIQHWHGSNFGIYIEPMVVLLVKHFSIKKMIIPSANTESFDKIIDGY
jgi:hypothetical protein